jgi:hypothetical protein
MRRRGGLTQRSRRHGEGFGTEYAETRRAIKIRDLDVISGLMGFDEYMGWPPDESEWQETTG